MKYMKNVSTKKTIKYMYHLKNRHFSLDASHKRQDKLPQSLVWDALERIKLYSHCLYIKSVFFKEVARGGERTWVLLDFIYFLIFTILPLSHSGSPHKSRVACMYLKCKCLSCVSTKIILIYPCFCFRIFVGSRPCMQMWLCKHA
jgi:hypothetical protein